MTWLWPCSNGQKFAHQTVYASVGESIKKIEYKWQMAAILVSFYHVYHAQWGTINLWNHILNFVKAYDGTFHTHISDLLIIPDYSCSERLPKTLTLYSSQVLWQVIVIFSLRDRLICGISNQLNRKLHNFTDFDIPVCLLIQERVNYLQQIIDEQT